MGAMVVASSPTGGDYYYNILRPDGQEEPSGDGARIESAGW
jgi:hypothetical protein